MSSIRRIGQIYADGCEYEVLAGTDARGQPAIVIGTAMGGAVTRKRLSPEQARLLAEWLLRAAENHHNDA